MTDHVEVAATIAAALEKLWKAADEHRELAMLTYLIEMALVEAKDRAEGLQQREDGRD